MGVTHAQYDGQKGQVEMVQAKWATTWINEGKFSWWPRDPNQQHLGGVSRHDYSTTMQSHHNPYVCEKALASIPFTINQLAPLMKVNHHLTKGKVVQRRSLMVKRNGF